MQTKLRVWGLVVVASLLWITPMSAVSQRAKVHGEVKKQVKMQYIGLASWYGAQHQGRKMANGKRFDRHKYTAASWYFPLGTVIRVENLKNGESVEVTITDRGPNLRLHRVLDLSEAAADLLGYVDDGLTPVFLYPVSSFDTTAASFDSFSLVETVTQASREYPAHTSAVPM